MKKRLEIAAGSVLYKNRAAAQVNGNSDSNCVFTTDLLFQMDCIHVFVQQLWL